MSRLYEYQSKKILKEAGIRIPQGEVACSPDDAFNIATKIGKPMVLKIQVWVTGRAGIGGIQFADTPEEAREKAIEILNEYLNEIPVRVEGYGRDDSPGFCAERMEKLIRENASAPHRVRTISEPAIAEGAYSFQTFTGKIFIDHTKCSDCQSKGCVPSCKAGILKLEEGKPILAISEDEARMGKCTECLACEIFCMFHDKDAITIRLPIPGLKEYRDRIVRKG